MLAQEHSACEDRGNKPHNTQHGRRLHQGIRGRLEPEDQEPERAHGHEHIQPQPQQIITATRSETIP